MMSQAAIQVGAQASVPSCVEIGLQATAKGDFELARKMLHAAMEQLDGGENRQLRLIELIGNIADTYLHEGNYNAAKNWYQKALHRMEHLQGTNAIQSACLMVRLAQVNCLQSNMAEFKKYFDKVVRSYLLAPEESVNILLNPLVDLSWALCVRGCGDEVRPVNELITQIKELENEDKATVSIA